MKNEELKNALREVFNAGMECQKEHPDDDSYDEVRFEKEYDKMNKTFQELWNNAVNSQMGLVFDHCSKVDSTNGHAIKHWVKKAPYPFDVVDQKEEIEP